MIPEEERLLYEDLRMLGTDVIMRRYSLRITPAPCRGRHACDMAVRLLDDQGREREPSGTVYRFHGLPRWNRLLGQPVHMEPPDSDVPGVYSIASKLIELDVLSWREAVAEYPLDILLDFRGLGPRAIHTLCIRAGEEQAVFRELEARLASLRPEDPADACGWSGNAMEAILQGLGSWSDTLGRDPSRRPPAFIEPLVGWLESGVDRLADGTGSAALFWKPFFARYFHVLHLSRSGHLPYYSPGRDGKNLQRDAAFLARVVLESRLAAVRESLEEALREMSGPDREKSLDRLLCLTGFRCGFREFAAHARAQAAMRPGAPPEENESPYL